MTVPVENRHIRWTLKEKLFCRVIVKKKICIHKSLHFVQLLFNDYTISESKIKVQNVK